MRLLLAIAVLGAGGAAFVYREEIVSFFRSGNGITAMPPAGVPRASGLEHATLDPLGSYVQGAQTAQTQAATGVKPQTAGTRPAMAFQFPPQRKG